ncbi:hypothetical protein FB567DRAFT_526744 [Paraphoma chrysanthemicola]|uniref:Uncharacterized protein n=1 Tax=Paraphoma chrysanthemicola TaxID=798071 RepID=A0A8K0R7S3_9PLEO|nr:hypothetical protein FB567DRAFT_526744 [Paraphoma chrysanthemicola]
MQLFQRRFIQIDTRASPTVFTITDDAIRALFSKDQPSVQCVTATTDDHTPSPTYPLLLSVTDNANLAASPSPTRKVQAPPPKHQTSFVTLGVAVGIVLAIGAAMGVYYYGGKMRQGMGVRKKNDKEREPEQKPGTDAERKEEQVIEKERMNAGEKR